VLDAFEEKLGIVILERYGLSETASTTTFDVSVEERKIYRVGCKPAWVVEVQIWDDENRPLPSGSEHVGEIVIRGGQHHARILWGARGDR
jgi:long-chain acyl-CoA synthetase